MEIVPFYAALLAFLFVYLSVRTIRLRRSFKIGIGHAKNDTLLRAIRVHANFAEYVPLALLLLFFVEAQKAHTAIVHGLCALLLLGRVLHAYGVSQERENFSFRVTGMAMTFTTMIASGLYIIVSGLFGF